MIYELQVIIAYINNWNLNVVVFWGDNTYHLKYIPLFKYSSILLVFTLNGLNKKRGGQSFKLEKFETRRFRPALIIPLHFNGGEIVEIAGTRSLGFGYNMY